MSKSILTPNAVNVRDHFSYDEATGFLTIKKSGKIAGHRKKAKGYVEIYFFGKKYLAHRFVWFYVYGTWPKDQIDHINGIRSDNRISNLREATLTDNNQNRRHCVGCVGLLGVFKSTRPIGKFRARIEKFIDGKRKIFNIGTFDTPEAAHAAYMKKKREIHPACAF